MCRCSVILCLTTTENWRCCMNTAPNYLETPDLKPLLKGDSPLSV